MSRCECFSRRNEAGVARSSRVLILYDHEGNRGTVHGLDPKVYATRDLMMLYLYFEKQGRTASIEPPQNVSYRQYLLSVGAQPRSRTFLHHLLYSAVSTILTLNKLSVGGTFCVQLTVVC